MYKHENLLTNMTFAQKKHKSKPNKGNYLH